MNSILKKISFLLIIFALVTTIASAQTTLQIKFAPIGIHPFNETNSHLFENRIDANGIFITEPCFILSMENFISADIFAWRAMFGFMSDAASKPALFLHLGVKQRLLQVWRNSISVGVGGNLYGRELWTTIYGYSPDNTWSANGDWEYKLGFMVELEYALFINDKNDITLSALYGHQPNTFSFTIGYKHWLSSKIKHPRKCGSCPFEKAGKHWAP